MTYLNERTKTKVLVETRCGKKVFGSIFMTMKDRLSDILNDDRKFLPIETSDEASENEAGQDGSHYKTIIIHKEIITLVQEV